MINTESFFKARMLECALRAAKALAEYAAEPEHIKNEPEQVRKNVYTILTILTETEDFFKEFPAVGSSSDNSISE